MPVLAGNEARTRRREMLSAEAQLHTPLRERIERRRWEREDRTGARQQRDARRASAGEREHLSFEVIPPGGGARSGKRRPGRGACHSSIAAARRAQVERRMESEDNAGAMVRRIDRAKVLASLSIRCTNCGYSVPPSEMQRVDSEHLKCPKCLTLFCPAPR